MLTAYQNATNALLQVPSAPTSLYPPTTITANINTARGQLAGEAQCIRVLGTLTTTVGVRNYNFSSISLSGSTGVQGVIHVRRILYNVGQGQQWIRPRPWEWFDLYKLNTPVPKSGPPTVWSQYAQGVLGSFYLDPIPDMQYTLQLDCVCYPISLVDDTTAEAIPYLWTDAVPFFAAYYTLLGSQSQARGADANRMFNYYTEFLGRARKFSTPSVNQWIYQQSVDPAAAGRLTPPPTAGAA